MTWSASLRLGSGSLADALPALRSARGQRARTLSRQHVAGAFEGLDIPHAALGVAVGGSATSLRRLVGALLEPETLERGLRVLAGAPARRSPRSYELDPERVQLLPAGIALDRGSVHAPAAARCRSPAGDSARASILEMTGSPRTTA